jgi:hypothetical protein
MSYNRKNFLLKVKKVNELYLHYKMDGLTTVYIFRKYIHPIYPMHEDTFYKLLGINYERQLRQIEESKKTNQTELF